MTFKQKIEEIASMRKCTMTEVYRIVKETVEGTKSAGINISADDAAEIILAHDRVKVRREAQR